MTRSLVLVSAALPATDLESTITVQGLASAIMAVSILGREMTQSLGLVTAGASPVMQLVLLTVRNWIPETEKTRS
jgi:hypothetical protein